MQCALKILVLVAASSTSTCRAHWKLTVPVPRSGSAYENDPLGSPVTCRNSVRNPSIPRPSYTAGQYMEIEFGAPNAPFGHVGDCSLYISYDVAVPVNAAQFVKIANLPDCRAQINTPVPILLPRELPGGEAILRWDQYALHQGSFIEWYAQCADITVTASSAEKSWDRFNKFSIPAVYPRPISEYRRSTALPGEDDFYMTGPACMDECINQCALTAEGTRGYTGYGGEEGQLPCTPMPSPSPVPVPVPVPVPSPNPTPPSGVTCEPIGNCGTYSWCTQAAYVDWCNSQDECPSPFCKTASSAPVPSPTPAPVPVPTPTPAPVPMPTPPTNGRRCVPTLEGFYNDPAVYGPICQAQERGNVCTAPMCQWEASLAQESVRRHRFLGLALIQGRADVEGSILRNGNEEL
eukprot:TRINITY_DN2140_c0_g1_i4.p1 TRINITY_DN2140_c0_g1~~TRINITY_DN2140_c0_g1_i4.p1  ORF type:complete len:425 (-),score=38.60 TRINITY_DN2140_c0_g1_i4:296-1516(-)